MFISVQYVNPRTKRLFLDNFVQNGSIRINKQYWKKINGEFDKEEIKHAIADVVRRKKLPVPGHPSEEQLASTVERLKAVDSRDLIQYAPGRVHTRKEYKWGLSDYYIQTGGNYNVVSDYYHRNERMQCGTFKFMSPYDAWTSRKMLMYCLNALWTMKFEECTDTTLFNCLALRQYAASQFRVPAAMALYDLFKAERVLDTSMGWGDRLAGFCFSRYGKEYYGFDPNFRLHPGYDKQINNYGHGREFAFVQSGSEGIEAPYPREHFDFMFTSPPYFETERYGRPEDENQSWVKFSAVELWLENFLFSTIDNIWYALKPGGYMAINIADLGVSYKSTDICDPMNDYIADLPDAYYAGHLGLRLSARPHTSLQKNEGNGKPVFVEPIWVWRKGEQGSIAELVKELKYEGGLH